MKVFNSSFNRLKILSCTLFLFSVMATASTTSVKTNFKRNDQGFQLAQVQNVSPNKQRCYISIDGYKLHFKLAPKQKSLW